MNIILLEMNRHKNNLKKSKGLYLIKFKKSIFKLENFKR